MFYQINKEWKIIGSSNVRIVEDWINVVELDLTPEEIEKIKIGYKYKKWKLLKTKEIEQYEKDQKIEKINQETKTKILEKYSQTDQTNLTREATRIIWELTIYKQEPNKEQLLILQQAKEADDFIKNTIQEWRKQKQALENN